MKKKVKNLRPGSQVTQTPASVLLTIPVMFQGVTRWRVQKNERILADFQIIADYFYEFIIGLQTP